MANREEFAKELNQHLQRQGRSASWLAKQLEVSASTVLRWCSGDTCPRNLDRVRRVADLLQVRDQAERRRLVEAAGLAYTEAASSSIEEAAVAREIPSPYARQVIAREITQVVLAIDDRLTLIEVALAEDATDRKNRSARTAIAPGLAEAIGQDYDHLIASERGRTLRHQLNAHPLPQTPGPAVELLYIQSQFDPTHLQFFYTSVRNLSWATELVFNALSAASAIPSESSGLAMLQLQLSLELVENRSGIAFSAAARLLAHLSSQPVTKQPVTKFEELRRIKHFDYRRQWDEPAIHSMLLGLIKQGEEILKKRTYLVGAHEFFLAKELEAYEALNQQLIIQSDDPWPVVIGKAISLRQFGRIDDAVAAFDRYTEMFAADDPTAARYALIARQFTLQMKTLGIVEGAIYVYEVAPGSAAARAGVTVGDIIVELAGQATPHMPAMEAVLETVATAQTIELVVLRWEADGRFRRLSLTLDGSPPLGFGYMPI